ncbi:tRNA-specific adenosine deaminase 2 [Blattella germanica]|nr:tRNA-specific adenosine deaminase 2 [Blattella germanica]
MDSWMEEAFVQANEALQVGEVPVGCVFVFNDQVIARSRNTVNETHNATRHAEMNCVDQTVTWCKETSHDFDEVMSAVKVWVTVEPCIMCAAALHSLRVAEVVYGCNNDRFGGCTSVFDTSLLYSPATPMKGGMQSDRAMQLLKDFYKGTNPNAPQPKVKKDKKVASISDVSEIQHNKEASDS